MSYVLGRLKSRHCGAEAIRDGMGILRDTNGNNWRDHYCQSTAPGNYGKMKKNVDGQSLAATFELRRAEMKPNARKRLKAKKRLLNAKRKLRLKELQRLGLRTGKPLGIRKWWVNKMKDQS